MTDSQSAKTHHPTDLTAELTAGVLKIAGRRIKEVIMGTPAEQTLLRCFQAAVAAIMPADDPARDAYARDFEDFLCQPLVQAELAKMLRGRRPNELILMEAFSEEMQGKDMPPFDFQARLGDFVEAFLLAVEHAPELREAIQSSRLRDATIGLRQAATGGRAIMQALQQVGFGDVSAQGDVNVEGDIVTGVKVEVYQQAAIAQADPSIGLLTRYLKALQHELVELPLAALDDEGADSRSPRITLDRVYIAQHSTRGRGQGRQERINRFPPPRPSPVEREGGRRRHQTTGPSG